MGIAEPNIEVPDGDAKKGAKLCKAKQGPPLWGIMGRQSGTYDGFNYSSANKESGIVWSGKHMFEYLINPKKYMPGTRMVFAGLKKEKERADLIAYLAAQGRVAVRDFSFPSALAIRCNRSS